MCKLVQNYNVYWSCVAVCGRVWSCGIYTRPPKLGPAHLQFIEGCMQENSELTAMELQARLTEELGISVSKATITKARRNLNWVYTGTAYCQMIREPNKIKRLAYCQQCLDTGEQFDNVIFTDETKIQMQSSLSRSCRKKGMARKLVCKPKHPYTVSRSLLVPVHTSM